MRRKKNIFELYLEKIKKLLPKKKRSRRSFSETWKNIFIKESLKNKTSKRYKQLVLKTGVFHQLQWFQNKLKTLYIWGFLLILGLVAFIIFGPVFTIKNIDIIRQDSITNMNISYNGVDSLRGKSIFSISEEDIVEKMKQSQNNIEEVSVQMILPDTLKMKVISSPALYSTILQEKPYFILKNGTVVPKKVEKEIKEITVVWSDKLKRFIGYKKIFEPIYLQRIQETITSLEENLINTTAESIIYYVNQRELHIITDKQNRIIFDIHQNTSDQIKKLAIYNKEKKDLSQGWIIYTDLRVNNKIFYCPESESYNCKKSLKTLYGSL